MPIDFAALEPLPLRRQRDKLDRERLAQSAHLAKCAKHKGLNHWRNWERRKMLAKAKTDGLAKIEAKKPALTRYADEVRRYWRGDRPDMPSKPG